MDLATAAVCLTLFDFETPDYRRKFFGCLGNFSIKNLSARNRASIAWEWKAIDVDISALALGLPNPATPTNLYPANMPAQGAIIRNTRISFGSTPDQIIASEFEFDYGNDVQPVLDTAAVNGIRRWQIVESARRFSFKADYANYGNTLLAAHRNKTLQDVLVEMTNGGAGNSFALAMPKLEIRELARVTVNGLDYLDVKCAISRNDDVPATPVPDVTFGIL